MKDLKIKKEIKKGKIFIKKKFLPFLSFYLINFFFET